MLDKPINQSVKDFVISNINYPKEVVEKVIAFQGEDILRAVKEYSQIEISGLGLLFVAKGKLNKRIDRYNTYLNNGVEKEIGKEETITKLLEFLKKKKCQNLQNT